MKKILKFIWKWFVIPLIGLAIILIAVWSTCAIYFAKSPAEFIRIIAAVIFILSNIAVFLNVKKRRYFIIFFAGSFIAVLLWWSLIPPSNSRNWAEQTAVLPHATFSNNFVTIYNVRNFDYKSEKEFTTNYYTKTYNLNKLKKLYLAISYWDNNRAIAHTMLSFEFENGSCVVLSVEVRREKGEEYSTFKNLFKMNEIIYVLADERDVIRLRTNYAHERVFLLPLKFSPEHIRKLLLDILKRVNELNKNPEFYNAIMENCTTSLIRHFANISDSKAHFYIEYLLNGRLGWRLYENGVIDTKIPPKEAKQSYYISDIAKKYDDNPDFSKKIRSHLPGGSSEKSLLNIKKTKPEKQMQKPETKANLEIGAVKWDSNFTSLKYSFGNGILKGCYPENMTKNNFPPSSQKPIIKVDKKWPDVFMNAKWTIDISDLKAEEKENILDSILMRVCNPDSYKKDFPKTIVSTEFTPPPEFKKEIENPKYNLFKSIKGKVLDYTVVMNAGFGASDYKIETKIYIGASKDGKTIFYYDKPEHISNHLDVREFVFAAHKEGNELFFEINIFCACEPSIVLRGTKMDRVENDSRYFIMQMYRQFN